MEREQVNEEHEREIKNTGRRQEGMGNLSSKTRNMNRQLWSMCTKMRNIYSKIRSMCRKMRTLIGR